MTSQDTSIMKFKPYKLKYKYKGSNNIWEHEFLSFKDYYSWKTTFEPFVDFIEE